MNDIETATLKARAALQQNYAWRWLLDRLADYVEMRGCRPEDDEALGKLYEQFYVEARFLLDPTGDIGPTADILSAFRETPALWLEACPSDQVVVVPRGILKSLLAALPVSTDRLFTPTLDVLEYHGAAFLADGAARHKYEREEREMADADRAKKIIDRVIAEHSDGPASAASADGTLSTPERAAPGSEDGGK